MQRARKRCLPRPVGRWNRAAKGSAPRPPYRTCGSACGGSWVTLEALVISTSDTNARPHACGKPGRLSQVDAEGRRGSLAMNEVPSFSLEATSMELPCKRLRRAMRSRVDASGRRRHGSLCLTRTSGQAADVPSRDRRGPSPSAPRFLQAAGYTRARSSVPVQAPERRRRCGSWSREGTPARRFVVRVKPGRQVSTLAAGIDAATQGPSMPNPS
jgi:hypothetical protein